MKNRNISNNNEVSIDIDVKKLKKTYYDNDTSLLVIKNLSINVSPGQFVSVFGPNGCGKTTLLNIISGITSFDEGEISVGIDSPDILQIGYVFQDYEKSLFPWRRAVDNIALPLESSIKSRKKRREYVSKFLKQNGILVPKNHYPYQMSGGQKQLVALGRALIGEPKILLMDEPFGALDYQTRMDMEDELLKVWERRRITTLFVSHEIDEAIYLADKLCILGPLPTSVIETINIDFPRPRKRKILQSSEFFKLRLRAIQSFLKAIEK